MVKYKPVKENAFKEYLSSLITPLLQLTQLSESKIAHRYHPGRAGSHVSGYFNRFVLESRIKYVYRYLEFLHHNSSADFEKQKEQGLIHQGLHPLKEKEWFIDYLRPRLEELTVEDIWLVMLNNGHREQYMRYLSRAECVNRFEIFVENYFFGALSKQMLVEVFLLAYEGSDIEREESLMCLMDCLCFKQTACLIDSLKCTISDHNQWVRYCSTLLSHMRNAQVKKVFRALPSEIEDYALAKLYPYEIVEVVEQLPSPSQRAKVIRKVLQKYKEWWNHFSHDEVKHALAILSSDS